MSQSVKVRHAVKTAYIHVELFTFVAKRTIHGADASTKTELQLLKRIDDFQTFVSVIIHVRQRSSFVSPLAVDRLVALVKPANPELDMFVSDRSKVRNPLDSWR